MCQRDSISGPTCYYFEKNVLHHFDFKQWQEKILPKYSQKHLQKKLSMCVYLGCSGRNFLPDADFFICSAYVLFKCFHIVSLDDTNACCSTDCIHFDEDASIYNGYYQIVSVIL